MGKFHIKRSASGKYFFTLQAGNGEIILNSELFDTSESVKSAINEVITNASRDGAFKIHETSNGKFYFSLTNNSGKTLGRSSTYASKASAENGITAVRHHGSSETASVIDSLISSKTTHKIGSVRTFISAIENLPQDAESVIFYRGHGNVSYRLLPSLYRNSGWIRNEHVIFHELVLRCPNDFQLSGPTFNTLVKMQHYSLPTRLLDITTNPLVALYFACIGGGSADAEVITFRIPKDEIRYYDSDRVSLISNIGRLPAHTRFPQGVKEKLFNSNEDVIRLVREVQREKPYFEARINPIDISSVVCVKPVLDNPRIIKQDGAFLLFGVEGEKGKPAEVPEKYLLSNSNFKVILRGSDKPRILEQLASLGITRSTIYPEIEHVAGHISEKYRDIY
ncbi:DUF1508 domain-containing protein [Pseudomonas chlororaphis]|uniref:DUF1508 domain-containing protein n=1 Tax=Pseudomonas chlororaphis TaxID=587753 RepID=UPI003462B5BB